MRNLYRDIGAYVTLHIVTHDVLLVAVRSRDFYVENGYQLAVDVSPRGRSRLNSQTGKAAKP